jgi:hypothetical protein
MNGYVLQAVGSSLLMTFVIGEAAEMHEKSVPLHAPGNSYGTAIVAQTSVGSSVALDFTCSSHLLLFRTLSSEPAERLADEVSQYRHADVLRPAVRTA